MIPALSVNQLIQKEQYLLNQFYQNLRSTIRRLSDANSADNSVVSEALAKLAIELEEELSCRVREKPTTIQLDVTV